VLLIDAANVVGSRPTGWWRDRPGAARDLVERVRAAARAQRVPVPVVIVLEGAARGGADEGTADGVEVVHAPGEGDDTIVRQAVAATDPVLVVTADRGLRRRLEEPTVEVVGPTWLLDRLAE
jgi:rRNA-processing protein FCF1